MIGRRMESKPYNSEMDLRDRVNAMKYHGTTTVALSCPDGVVLCTDTRVTAGYLFIAHRRGKKMYKIDNHVGVTIAGTVADAQNVTDTLKYYANIYRLENMERIPIKSLARIAANIFFSQRLYPFIADFLIGGVDEKEGPSIYSVDFFGALTKEDMVSTGSGIPVAIRAVNAAIKRNAGTGDGFDVAIITKESGYRELSSEEKNKLLASALAGS